MNRMIANAGPSTPAEEGPHFSVSRPGGRSCGPHASVSIRLIAARRLGAGLGKYQGVRTIRSRVVRARPRHNADRRRAEPSGLHTDLINDGAAISPEVHER